MSYFVAFFLVCLDVSRFYRRLRSTGLIESRIAVTNARLQRCCVFPGHAHTDKVVYYRGVK
jgi:hypothetical protein